MRKITFQKTVVAKLDLGMRILEPITPHKSAKRGISADFFTKQTDLDSAMRATGRQARTVHHAGTESQETSSKFFKHPSSGFWGVDQDGHIVRLWNREDVEPLDLTDREESGDTDERH